VSICASCTATFTDDKSGWMICAAVAVKRHLTTVLIVAGEFTTATIMKPYQLRVATVSYKGHFLQLLQGASCQHCLLCMSHCISYGRVPSLQLGAGKTAGCSVGW